VRKIRNFYLSTHLRATSAPSNSTASPMASATDRPLKNPCPAGPLPGRLATTAPSTATPRVAPTEEFFAERGIDLADSFGVDFVDLAGKYRRYGPFAKVRRVGGLAGTKVAAGVKFKEVESRRNAERARLRAERDQLGATGPEGLADAWAMIEAMWADTVGRARELPEPVLHQQVNGEWSFVQTQRHLVLVTDCWLRRMVKGMAHPYHSWGLAGPWLTNPRRWGINPEADPTLDQVLDLRRERMDEVASVIASAHEEELERTCVAPAAPGHPHKDHTVLQCLHMVLKEEWQHHRYAVRDLAVLEVGPRQGLSSPSGAGRQ
jgi:DinB superfamily